MRPHIHCTLSLFLNVESCESLNHRPPPGMSRKCMCGGDDHLAPSLRRCVGGCVPFEGIIAPARDPFKRPTHLCLFRATIDLFRLSLYPTNQDSHPTRGCICEPSGSF